MAHGIPDIETIKALNKTVTDEFRANDGKVGQPRVSPLAYFRIDGKLLIIGSFAGADIDPGWVHNLRANPSAHVEIGTDSSDVTARELPSAERDELFGKISAAAPGFAEYQARTPRVIPVFELQSAS
jgi:deazaflavin-dependent oxidoreductase (nitroreductase family)